MLKVVLGTQELVWTMNLVLVLLNMGMHTVTGLLFFVFFECLLGKDAATHLFLLCLLEWGDQIWAMGAAEVPSPARNHMVCMAVVRVWVMEEVRFLW